MTYSALPNTSISNISTHNKTYSVPTPASNAPTRSGRRVDLLSGVRQWLNQVNINDSRLAHGLCRLIPMQCPFERDIVILGRTVAHIPPLCKLNPLYEEVVGLRFRALCYLADECGEDVQQYC